MLRTQKQSLQHFYSRQLSLDNNNGEFLAPNLCQIKLNGNKAVKIYSFGAIPRCKELKLEWKPQLKGWWAAVDNTTDFCYKHNFRACLPRSSCLRMWGIVQSCNFGYFRAKVQFVGLKVSWERVQQRLERIFSTKRCFNSFQVKESK